MEVEFVAATRSLSRSLPRMGRTRACAVASHPHHLNRCLTARLLKPSDDDVQIRASCSEVVKSAFGGGGMEFRARIVKTPEGVLGESPRLCLIVEVRLFHGVTGARCGHSLLRYSGSGHVDNRRRRPHAIGARPAPVDGHRSRARFLLPVQWTICTWSTQPLTQGIHRPVVNVIRVPPWAFGSSTNARGPVSKCAAAASSPRPGPRNDRAAPDQLGPDGLVDRRSK